MVPRGIEKPTEMITGLTRSAKRRDRRFRETRAVFIRSAIRVLFPFQRETSESCSTKNPSQNRPRYVVCQPSARVRYATGFYDQRKRERKMYTRAPNVFGTKATVTDRRVDVPLSRNKRILGTDSRLAWPSRKSGKRYRSRTPREASCCWTQPVVNPWKISCPENCIFSVFSIFNPFTVPNAPERSTFKPTVPGQTL